MKEKLWEMHHVEVRTLASVIECLNERGYTQTDLSEMLGISLSAMSLYAADKRDNQAFKKLTALYKLLEAVESDALDKKPKVKKVLRTKITGEDTEFIGFYG